MMDKHWNEVNSGMTPPSEPGERRIGGRTRKEWQSMSRELWHRGATNPTTFYPVIAAAFAPRPESGQDNMSLAGKAVAAASIAMDCTHVSQHYDQFLVACGPCVHKGIDYLLRALALAPAPPEKEKA